MTTLTRELKGQPRTVTQGWLAHYAEVSGDRNPLHLNPAFAATTPYGKTVAHGMLVLALVSELLTVRFGMGWLAGGKLRVRFRAPIFVGDRVTASARLRSVAPDGAEATYDVAVRNQAGAGVITGEAKVSLVLSP